MTIADQNNDAVTPETAQPKKQRGKKILTALFNMAAGAVVTGAAKALTGVCMSCLGAPAVATLLVSAFAVGIASTLLAYKLDKNPDKKLWSRKTAKTFLKRGGFALIGGALFMGFHEGIFHNLFGAHDAGAAIAPPVVPHVPEAVVPPPCPSATEAFAQAVDGHHVSDAVHQAMTRAASGNAHVAAQGVKDLGYYSMHGFDGVPKDTHLAAELFQKAADAGNAQAQTDLVYLQNYGFGGVVENKVSALTTMSTLPGHRAADLATSWAQITAPNPEPIPFDSRLIMQGFAYRCP